MKKFLLLLATAALAFGASAQKGEFKQFTNNHNMTVNEMKADLKAPAYAAEDVIVDQPEGTLVSYDRSGEAMVYYSGWGLFCVEQDGKADVVYAEDGKTVYLKDPIYGIAVETWVKGELSEDGTTITVPTGQFIYWSEENQYGLILDWGSTTIDDEGYITYTSDDRVTEFTYTIDGDKIMLNDTEGDMDTYVCTGLSAIWNDDLSWQGYMDWKTVYTVHAPATPAVPANPSDLTWNDYGATDGYNRFGWVWPTTDVDGNALDPEYLSYSIFLDDDEIFTFTPEEYGANNDVYENMTEIPYGFSGWDFYNSSVYFYRTNAEGYDPFFDWRIGIQVYYTVDGVRNASDIVYLEVFPHTGVAEMNAGKTVANVRYFNAAGQEMSEANGLTIVRTTYTDGTTSTAKVIK